MHHFATWFGYLADRIADGRGLELAGMGNGKAEDCASVKRAVCSRCASVETTAHGWIGRGEELGRGVLVVPDEVP